MDASTPTIVLHHLVDSRSERIFWALEELGLSYEVVVHQRSRFGGATKSLGQATESGKAPSLQLDGEWLSESAYILHRLLAYTLQRQNGQSATHQHPAVQLHASTKTSATGLSPAQASLTPHTEASPAGIGASTSSPATSSSPSSSDAQVSCPMRTPDSINVELVPSNPSIHFAHWAEGSLMLWMQAFLLHRLTTNQFISGRLPIGGKTVDEGMVQGMQEWSKWAGGVIYKPGTQRNIDAMESFIKDHAYFSSTNQPGIGDFMLAYPMSTLILENDQGKKGPYEIGEGLKKWMARVRARPAYQKAQKRLKAEEDAQRPAAQAKL